MRWFRDRPDAGRQLADRLVHLRGTDAVVLGLPWGGVPVAFEVARRLGAPLDVLVVRKFAVPHEPHLVLGAVGEGGVLVLNDEVVAAAGLDRVAVAEMENDERTKLERRAARFHDHRPRMDLAGRTAVVVDDGMVTGATARAACQVARAHGAARVVLAVPACPPPTAELLRRDVDELVVLETPEEFFAVGQVYAGFRPVRDDEIMELLQRAAHPESEPAGPPVS